MSSAWYSGCLGAWFRKIANQSADFCERVVEAQFAAHTKGLKSRRREQDAEFLAERVIDPEMLLRSADDRLPDAIYQPGDDEEPATHRAFLVREPRAGLSAKCSPALSRLP